MRNKVSGNDFPPSKKSEFLQKIKTCDRLLAEAKKYGEFNSVTIDYIEKVKSQIEKL
ncbi:MAG: hypothetical protein WCR52_23695 [Bacteroidota bacterium]